MLRDTDDIYRAKNSIMHAAATREQGDKAFELFVALAAAMSLDLPSSGGVNLASVAISEGADKKIAEYIAPINECCIIDYKAVKHLAVQIYNFRYAMVYGGYESIPLLLAALSNSTGDIIAANAVETLSAFSKDKAMNEAINIAMRIAAAPNN